MYRLLEKLPWYYMENKPEFDVARRHLAGAERVLEVGAGAGAFGRLLAGQGAYVGLEFNSSAVEQAVASGLDVRRESLGEHLASGPGTYDAVVTFQVMEHVPAVGQFIRECRRCLRPGGRLIVSVPSHDGFMGSELNNILDLPPHHITQWSDRTLAAVASQFDLTLVALDHDDMPHRIGPTTCTRRRSTTWGSAGPMRARSVLRAGSSPSTRWSARQRGHGGGSAVLCSHPDSGIR